MSKAYAKETDSTYPCPEQIQVLHPYFPFADYRFGMRVKDKRIKFARKVKILAVGNIRDWMVSNRSGQYPSDWYIVLMFCIKRIFVRDIRHIDNGFPRGIVSADCYGRKSNVYTWNDNYFDAGFEGDHFSLKWGGDMKIEDIPTSGVVVLDDDREANSYAKLHYIAKSADIDPQEYFSIR
jgi:hypothetical protein